MLFLLNSTIQDLQLKLKVRIQDVQELFPKARYKQEDNIDNSILTGEIRIIEKYLPLKLLYVSCRRSLKSVSAFRMKFRSSE